MKWHEWVAFALAITPTVVFAAACVYSFCEPLAHSFQRKRGMSGG